MIRRTMTSRLPSIHPFAGIDVFVGKPKRFGGLEEILFGREKFVGSRQHNSAQALRREVNEFRKISIAFCEIGHRSSTRPMAGVTNFP